jgi:hypothetical protein
MLFKDVEIMPIVISEENKKILQEIVNNTSNTWQSGRSEEEKYLDTLQGKIAEDLFQEYVRSTNIDYLSYDSIRNDNFLKHAPIDGLLFRKSLDANILNESIKLVLNDVAADQHGRINVSTRETLRSRSIYIVEIKSTKVNDRKRGNKSQIDYQKTIDLDCLVQNIKKDDFLTYPHFCRIGNISDLDNYYRFVVRQNPGVNKGKGLLDLMDFELANMPDILVRIYIDFVASKGLIIGYILREEFIKNVELKKMVKPGKSEGALYFAKNLRYGISIIDLPVNRALWF